MGVVIRKRVLVESMGVVVRRYIDFIILLSLASSHYIFKTIALEKRRGSPLYVAFSLVRHSHLCFM